ncbi:MAG: hypothetical protein ACOC1O_02485 [bacterium]
MSAAPDLRIWIDNLFKIQFFAGKTLKEMIDYLQAGERSCNLMSDSEIDIENITWYHGSPLKLDIIKKGSTITPDKKLAEVFSHKPAIVMISDEGEIKHNGKKKGYLYKIEEKVESSDVYPHPNTTMEKGKEWLTNRELKVKLVKEVKIWGSDKLSKSEIKKLKEKQNLKNHANNKE